MKIHSELPKNKPPTPLLDSLSDVSLIRKFSYEELLNLTDEIREYLL